MRHPFLRSAGSELKDPNFKNVTLLLHGDGTNGGQNNTFVDGSTNNFTITRNGNTTQGTFSPYGDNWSNYFDGNGDYLSIANNSAFGFGTGDFTIECWFYIFGNSSLNASSNRLAALCTALPTGGATTTGYELVVLGNSTTTGTGLEFKSSVSGTGYSIVYNGTISQATWHHIAVVRSGTLTSIYFNGTSVASGTLGNQNVSNSTHPLFVGASRYASYLHYLNGYTSNLRILKGTAQYTAAFTPPTTPLTAITNTSLLTCQSNRFLDNSTNAVAITRNGDVSVQRFSPFSPTAAYAAGTIGGSGYFDGTADYLSAASNAAFSFGTGNFTIECFFYPTSTDSSQYLYVLDSTQGIIWGFDVTPTIASFVLGRRGIGFDLQYAYTIVPFQWLHLVAVRSGTTASLYINGTRVATGTNSQNYTVSGPVNVGAIATAGGYEANGYISNLRVVKGTAVYDPAQSTLTVPTAPLTAITNTSLLLNFTNAAILDNAMMAVPETVGDVKISTSVKKYGTGSLSFDGNSDYLWIKNAGNLFDLSAGNFTVELWFYAMDKGDSESAESLIQQNEQTWRIWLRKLNGPRVLSYTVNGTNAFFTAGNLFNWDTWNHVAICKSGTTTTMYLNGVSVGTTTLVPAASSGPVYIGSNLVGTTVYWPMLGYIDDIRVTKGVARYTANFTAPTAPFPNL